MVATVQISETNAGPTTTDNIANMNYGSVDAVTLDPVANPIAQSTYSFEKYNRLKVASGTFSVIDNIRVFRSSPVSLATGMTQRGNQTTSGYSAASFAAPVSTASAKAVNTMPTSAPGLANLGIGGSLVGTITATGSYSDYWVTQLQAGASAAAGETITNRWQYDEVA